MNTTYKEVSKVEEFLLGMGFRQGEKSDILGNPYTSYSKRINLDTSMYGWFILVQVLEKPMSNVFYVSVYSIETIGEIEEYKVHSVVEMYTLVHRMIEEYGNKL